LSDLWDPAPSGWDTTQIRQFSHGSQLLFITGSVFFAQTDFSCAGLHWRIQAAVPSWPP